MDLTATATLDAAPTPVFAEVSDLGNYPQWLGIVAAAVPAPAHRDDPGPAWAVDLVGRLGLLRRTKRVRMVRMEHRAPAVVRFERLEHDGRSHSDWVLSAEVKGTRHGSRLTFRLHYGGAPRLPGLEALLKEEVRRAGGRLEERLAGSPRGDR